MRVHYRSSDLRLRRRLPRAALGVALLLALVSAAVPILVGPATAAGEVYVGPSGDDALGSGAPSSPYRSITKGIEAAEVLGVDVLVLPGTYASDVETFPIDVPSGMTVRSTDGAGATFVEGDSANPVFTGSNQSTATVIQGFTIANGGGTHGGGIRLEHSAAQILDNIIEENAVTGDGGGIHVATSTPLIARSWIRGNSAAGDGGGVSVESSSAPLIQDSVIASNTAGPSGGGVHVGGADASAVIVAATIVGNDAALGAGVSAETSVTATVTGSILWDNGDDLEGCVATYSDIQTSADAGGIGNISADPVFLDSDLRLARTSPCLDVSLGATATATDIVGVERPQDGDGDGNPLRDMGAYEMPYFVIAGDAEWVRSTETTADSSFGGATLGGAFKVRFDAGPGFGAWLDHADSLPATLTTGDGVKSVVAEFLYTRDYAGEETTATYSLEDTVTLDATPPTGSFEIGSGGAWTTTTTVSLDTSAIAGADLMSFSLLDDGAGDPGWVPETAFETSAGPLELTSAEGTKTVIGTFRDQAGNSLDVTRTIALDTTPPMLTVSSPTHEDSVWSNDAYPTVGWGAVDAVTGVADYSVSVAGGSAEATTATSKAWTEAAQEGDTVIAVVARDRAGHESAQETFTLKIDTLPPTEPAVSSPSHDPGVYSSDFSVEVEVDGATDPGAPATGSGIARFYYSWTKDAPSDSSRYDQGAGFDGDTRSLPDGAWYFNVQVADGADNRSDYVHSGPYLIDTKAPGAPRAPVASSASGIVGLDWPDNPESDVTSYKVYRSEGSGAVRYLGEVTGSAFTDRTVENGVTYAYRVTAVDHLDHESEPSPAASVTPWADNVVSRTAGGDRYQTAVAIADEHFDPADVENVVLATGEDFADALAASGLAGAYEAPLLLVRRGQVPPEVFERIDAYPNLERIFIVGGTGVVSEWVQAAFAQRYSDAGVWGPTGVLVQRFAGATRYDTAAAVALQVFRATDGESAERVLVARGDVFADALAIAPIAYATKRPVLLVTPSSLPVPVTTLLRDLRVKEAVVAGGPGAVSDGAVAQLDAQLAANGGTPSERWYGSDRYATAAAIADGGIQRGWVEPMFVGTATGVDFPDALGGGIAAGSEGGVLVLTAPAALSASAAAFVDDRAAQIERLEVFGGAGAVAPAVEAALEGLLD